MAEQTLEDRILGNSGAGHPSLLCQPDADKGCGGCCAHFDQPKRALEKVFSARKKAYDARGRTEDDMLLYRQKTDLLEKGYRQCRFLAFLDDRNMGVGCLLHPGRPENAGKDLRDHGFYEDCGFCAVNFCASSKNLLKRDVTDKQFFLLIQQDLDWYEYSRLFSFYVDLDGVKGLFDIYVRFTRPLYEAILQRLSFRDLKGKGFRTHYDTLIQTIVRRVKPSLPSSSEGEIHFQEIIEILADRKQSQAVGAEIERFVGIFDVQTNRR